MPLKLWNEIETRRDDENKYRMNEMEFQIVCRNLISNCEAVKRFSFSFLMFPFEMECFFTLLY